MRPNKLLSIFVAIMLVTSIANAQDTLHLMNNRNVECIVIDVTDTLIEYKKYSKLDRSIHSIDRSKVLSISYEYGDVEIINDTIIAPKTYKSRGYEISTEIFAGGVMNGTGNYTYGIEIINSYRFNKLLTLGVGVGYRYHSASRNENLACEYIEGIGYVSNVEHFTTNTLQFDGQFLIPIHARVKVNIPTNTADSPFFLCDVGYSFAVNNKNKDSGGFFIEPAIGVDIRLNNSYALYIAAGVNCYKYSYFRYKGFNYSGSYMIYNKYDYLTTMNLKLGFKF